MSQVMAAYTQFPDFSFYGASISCLAGDYEFYIGGGAFEVDLETQEFCGKKKGFSVQSLRMWLD